MPHVNIWIRKENEDKWNKIPDKSNWVNTILANSDDTTQYGRKRPSKVGPIVTVLSETINEEPIKRPTKKTGLCKQHGIDKALCINMKHAGAQ